MRRPTALFSVMLAIGAIILVPGAGSRADGREDGGPFEIEKCQTISLPGSYKLVKNLTIPSGNCLVITTSFVTIDLAGFSITGGGSSPGTAVGTQGQLQGIAVRNGSIFNFTSGIGLDGVGSIVEGMRLVGPSGGPGPTGAGIAANGIVRGNTVIGFGPGPGSGTGISATGVVTGNYVTANRFAMFIGEGSTVIGNTAFANQDIGIDVSCPSNLTDNTIGNGLILTGAGCNNTNNVVLGSISP